MKKGLALKFVIMALLMICTLISISSHQAYATTSGTQMYSGVDYSGQGTVIDKNLRVSVASTSGSYLSVPVYLGQYQNQQILTNEWIWHSWTGWSPSNYKSNNYITYRGEGITEYLVESKAFYKYQRWNDQLNPVYGYMYYTEYQGNQWWNFYINTTDSSTSGYPGPIGNYNIVRQYREYRILYYNGGYDYTGYQEYPPNGIEGLGGWVKSSQYQTWYRYKERWITWNPNTRDGSELVPLKYSLKNRNNTPLGLGIKLVANHTFSPRLSTNLFNPTPDNWDYNLKTYYLDTNVLEEQLHYTIMTMNTNDPFILALKAQLQTTGTSVFTILGVLAAQYSANAVLAGLSTITAYAGAIILPINIANIWLQYQKSLAYNNLVDAIGLWDQYNYIGIQFQTYLSLDNENMLFPIRDMSITLIDRKDSTSDNLTSISLSLSNNQFNGSQGILPNPYKNLGLDYYGTVTYVDDLSELEQDMNAYFNSFDIFDIFGWFGL